MGKVESINRFKQTIKNILNDGNMVTFEFYNKDNDGIIINEWDTIEENGATVPNEWLTSQVENITINEAEKALSELEIVYPIIDDIDDE